MASTPLGASGLDRDCRIAVLVLMFTTLSVWIGAVPHDRLDLALPHVSLERLLGLSPYPEIEPRFGEAAARACLTFDVGVGPDGVQPLHRGHVDELVQVAVPGAAIIVEKQQPSTAINENPAGREDGRDIAKRADIEPEAGQEIDEEQRAAQRNTMDDAWLDERQACEVVLETIIAAFFPRVFFRVFGGPCDERYGVLKLLLVLTLTPARDAQKHDTEPVQDNGADHCVGGDQQSLVDQPFGSRPWP